MNWLGHDLTYIPDFRKFVNKKQLPRLQMKTLTGFQIWVRQNILNNHCLQLAIRSSFRWPTLQMVWRIYIRCRTFIECVHTPYVSYIYRFYSKFVLFYNQYDISEIFFVSITMLFRIKRIYIHYIYTTIFSCVDNSSSKETNPRESAWWQGVACYASRLKNS